VTLCAGLCRASTHAFARRDSEQASGLDADDATGSRSWSPSRQRIRWSLIWCRLSSCIVGR